MHEPPTETLCAKKVSATVTNDNEVDADDYFIFIHFKLLKEFLMEIIKCPNCGCNDVAFSNVSKSRMGFANKIAVKCNLCIWNNNFFTSPECKTKSEKASQGRNQYEINVRSVVATHEIGKGHEGLQNFFLILNMQSLTQNAYNKINHQLEDLYSSAAESSMKNTGIQISEDNILRHDGSGATMCRITIAGAWQKRGYSSLNGYVAGLHKVR